MSAQIAQLVIDFKAETAGIRRDLEDVRRSLKRSEDGIKGLAASAKGLLAGAVTFQAVQASVLAVVRVTGEAEKAQAKLQAVLRATGHAAGFSSAQLGAMADELEDTTLFDGEQLKNAAAVLATFRNVQGQVYRDAVRGMADLAATMDGDLKDAALQLGKALNDPLKGITALNRAGVTFNAEQERTIRKLVATGNIAGAQRIILQELANQVGGVAGSQRTGLVGAFKEAGDAWDDLIKKIGNAQESDVGKMLELMFRGAARWLRWMAGDDSPEAKIKQFQDRVSGLRQELERGGRYVQSGPGQHAGSRFVAFTEAEKKELQEEIKLFEQRIEAQRQWAEWVANGKGQTGATTPPEDPEAEARRKAAEAERKALREQLKVLREQRRVLAMNTEELTAYHAAKVVGRDGRNFRGAIVSENEALREQVHWLQETQRIIDDGQADLKAFVRQQEQAEEAAKRMAIALVTGMNSGKGRRVSVDHGQRTRDPQALLWEQSWRDSISGVQGALAEFFMFKEEEATFRGFLSRILQAWHQAMAQLAAGSIIRGAGKLLGLVGGGVPTGPDAEDLGVINSFEFHRGGVVGSGGRPRAASAAAFLDARRYHRGGVAGLAPDEVPAILQRGETVLPRGASAGGGRTVINVYSTHNHHYSAVDATGMDALLRRHAGTIADINLQTVKRSRGYRRQLLTGG